MYSFFKEANLDKSKMELIANFDSYCNQHIYKKINSANLMITSYNVNFFSAQNKDKNLEKNVQFCLKRFLKFCKKTASDIILVQEALFNKNIISIFKNEGYNTYFCITYKIGQYYVGNMILIRNNIIIQKISREFNIFSYKKSKKCIINVIIEYQNTTISIYNINLNFWDNTEISRLEQINKLLDTLKMDKSPNILIGGDFNALKKSDYLKEERFALKKYYSAYTDNPFKEIDLFIKNDFIDCAINNIMPTVWNKQRVDFLFVNRDFFFDILNYSTHTISGSDHFPISIEIGIKKTSYHLVDPNKKLVYKNNYNSEYILKILPIWNFYWKKSSELLYKIGLSKASIYYGIKNAWNEYTITKYISKLVSNNISYSFVPIISAKKAVILPKEIKEIIPEFEKIPNQKYYFLKQQKLQECPIFNKKNTNLIVFQMQWALFIAYKLFGFIHGDILQGKNYNLLCYTYKLPGKKFLIVRYNQNIWKFSLLNEELPVIVLYDFGFSDLDYKNIHIHNKIPKIPMEESTSEKKWELDIQGYNIFFNKIGIERKIPNISLKDYSKLLEGFDTYKISLDEYRKIDKSKYLLFDGNTKKF
jgi:endonuclease/exonuclease/phosphatase family metal-dependent hydrolase